MKNVSISNQAGFTLIELVVVIIVLGILSAVAVPKFFSLRLDAQNAALESLKGSIESGLSISRSKMLIDDEANDTDIVPSFCTECTNPSLNYQFDYGYPQDAYSTFPLLFPSISEQFDTASNAPWFVTPTFGENWIQSRDNNANGCYLIYKAPSASEKTYTLTLVPCT